jgi:carbon-monoxide dehydrogenase medium subunit
VLTAIRFFVGRDDISLTQNNILRYNFYSASSRIMRPQGVALPIMNFSAKVRVIDDRIEAVALAVAPVAPTPFRCQQTEAFLTGKLATSESIEAAVAVLLSECKPRTSPHRATAEYRKEVLPVLLRRTLGKAIERAQTGEVVPEIYRVE